MKKFIIFVMAIVLTMSLALSPVYAAETEYEKVVSEVYKTNAEIDSMISKAIQETEKVMENHFNEEQSKRDQLIEDIIAKLISDTNKKATEMINKAADEGIKVVCELVEVAIGGQLIEIDPLRIIGF